MNCECLVASVAFSLMLHFCMIYTVFQSILLGIRVLNIVPGLWVSGII